MHDGRYHGVDPDPESSQCSTVIYIYSPFVFLLLLVFSLPHAFGRVLTCR